MEHQNPVAKSSVQRARPVQPALEDDLQVITQTTMPSAIGTTGPLSVGNVMNLQRSIGNQATMRLLGRTPTAPAATVQRVGEPPVIRRHTAPRIQRWNLRGTAALPWNTTQQISTIDTGQPVFFFTDNGGDRIVVKGEDTPVGVGNLIAQLHMSIHGTPTVYTRDVTSDKAAIIQQINNPAKSNHQSWTDLGNTGRVQGNNWGQGSPAANARYHHTQQLGFLPKMHAMSVAPGKTMGKIASPGGAAPNERTARALLDDAGYVQKLGEISAVDLFLENPDRVWSANFGNWFNAANGDITLIDNMDANTKGMFNAQSPMDSDTYIRKLAKGQLQQSAVTLVDWLRQGLENAGDGTAGAWMNAQKGTTTRKAWMEAQMLKGLKEGKKKLIRRLSSRKGWSKGRAIKAGATQAYNTDTTTNDNPATAYWNALKVRARWLSKN